MSLSDRESEQGEFGFSEDLVTSPNHKAKATKAVTFDGLLTTPLNLHEDLAKGNGGQAWPAGMILTKYILRRKQEEMENASIVELGAGGGLVGLAVAVECTPSVVHTTDMEVMLDLMQQNIALNQLQERVKASVYNWGEARPELIPQHPDVVLAADCVYFEPAFPLLLQTLQDLIGPQTVCYFCFKRRRRADMHFLKAVKKLFVVEDVKDDPEAPSYQRENIFLLTIRRKADR